MENTVLEKLEFLQDGLNEFITPDWKKNRTPLDFIIASLMETAELIDTTCEVDGVKHSTNWKWWKGANGARTTDVFPWETLHQSVVNNIKIELTDLLFFTLSQQALENHDSDNDADGGFVGYELNNNDWENFTNIIGLCLRNQPESAVDLILQLSEKLNFNISSYYMAKHLLNYYRQISKYGNGYEKVKNGKEDNELLHDIISDITFEAINSDFEGTYNLIASRFFEIFKAPKEKEVTFDFWKNFVK